ncbi:MAG: flavin reductase family protein [Anaerolineae bacterium]|nr:flavin reductase family protein [Anaerolineae bacterium]
MKVNIGAVPYMYPVPIVLVGALVEDAPNFVTIGDCGLMGIRPPLVFVSSHRDHYTNQGILANQAYSINLPTTNMLTITDYCGTVSGQDVDKGALFETFYGALGTAPLIARCPVNLACRVVKEFCIEHRQIFVGEVVETFVSEQYVVERNGKREVADLMQLDPILYALDNRYYRVGAPIGIGYAEARKFTSD